MKYNSITIFCSIKMLDKSVVFNNVYNCLYYVTVGINLGTVWSLFYYWTSKLINLLFPSFPNSHHLRANFPNYKGPWPQIQMSRKITVLQTCINIWNHPEMMSIFLELTFRIDRWLVYTGWINIQNRQMINLYRLN
jgi:hypothetical protein